MNEPIYQRGFRRAAYDRMRKPSYQPPVECSHAHAKRFRNYLNMRGLDAVRCPDCGMVVAVKLASTLQEFPYVEIPPRPLPAPKPTQKERLADWLDARELELRRLISLPGWLSEWWNGVAE